MKQFPKRMLAFLMAGVMMVSGMAAFAAEQIAFQVDCDISRGVMEAAVIAPKNSQLTDGRIVFTYNTRELTLTAAEAGALLQNADCEYDINTNVPGVVSIAWAGEELTSKGSLLDLTFQCLRDVEDAGFLKLSVSADDLYCGETAAEAKFTLPTPELPTPNPGKDPEPSKPFEPEDPELPFGDVDEDRDWFYDAVKAVYENGLMTGTSATLFSPDAITSRATIWTTLARMEGEKVDGCTPWYSLAQTWAMNSGVSDGTNPDGSITREQLAAMLYRYAQTKEQGYNGDGSFGLTNPDAGKVSDWALEAMCWCVENGIVQGDANGYLNPQGGATRAATAAMLSRFYDLVK